ncbi:hypothetical protein AKJ09_05929 [Labilithrix luteola]|uniref:Uncharacterized protein n=1 Tax=Labilithrix luteola TaxID=1391654 RepID=A0A0K1Q0H1_9BACT|nr:hypothetical protein AKJ09_05929 [Labilithrix luteola]
MIAGAYSSTAPVVAPCFVVRSRRRPSGRALRRILTSHLDGKSVSPEAHPP